MRTTTLLLFNLLVSISHAASFDCVKAKSPVEKAICADAELSKLDEDLSQIYKVAVTDYPVANYLKIKQREWIKANSYCDKSKIISCLKENFRVRIKNLSEISKIQIYSNTSKFSYEDGDAVAEIRRDGNKYLINIWGGARIHRQYSIDSGKPVYTECEFEGTFTSPEGGKATNKRGETFTFKIIENKITYEDDTQICAGFASLPDFLNLIKK